MLILIRMRIGHVLEIIKTMSIHVMQVLQVRRIIYVQESISMWVM
jgi:hypothetical protein